MMERASGYRDLGNLAVSVSHSTGLSCHHCKVSWAGCAAESCCPECGAAKGYHPDDHDRCYCDACKAAELSERIVAGEIKALSIKQPYPHYIFNKGKDVENRDWPTKGRGWFIIHTGVSKSELADSEMDLPRGGIVGMARIVDCVSAMDSQWFFGKYGFVLRDAFPVPLIPCRGQLSFFTPPQEALDQLATAIRERNGSD